MGQTVVITLTCVTFTSRWWDMKKWSLFVQVRRSHEVACIHKRQVFTKYVSHVKPVQHAAIHNPYQETGRKIQALISSRK
jgi:hypothetical protein